MFIAKDKFDDKSSYRKLADAIILQAVDDYRKLLRSITPMYFTNKINTEEIESFFKSRWFGILTNIDGEVLIEKLQEELKNE